jgi:hypothetical protein
MAFRETSLGVSLQEAITSLKGSPSEFSAAQEKNVWLAFEESMRAALAETPKDHIARLKMKSSAESQAQGLPAYRCIDGHWQVALGPAELELNAAGISEKLDVDFVWIDAVQM